MTEEREAWQSWDTDRILKAKGHLLELLKLQLKHNTLDTAIETTNKLRQLDNELEKRKRHKTSMGPRITLIICDDLM